VPQPWDDVDPFFDASETDVATWTAAGGSAVAGRVHLARPDELVFGDVAATDVAVVYRPAQWPTVRSGDAVVVAGLTYTVRGAPLYDTDRLTATALLKRL
jgi:hypothetical protein